MSEPERNKSGRLKVLVLYDDWTAQTAAVRDQLSSFRKHSENECYYAVATLEGAGADDVAIVRRLAACFDVIVLHHSVRLYVAHYINAAWAEVLASYSGYKVLFLQDDYERTETARGWIEKIGFNAFFTVVPSAYWDQVYPRSRFPKMEMQQVLTAYVPHWAKQRQPVKPLSQRSRFIGYRAFKLPFYFGDLAREKFMIGVKMREICEARGIPVDIEWETDKRIYGEAWYDFIEDSRATLGTESGSNVFDEDGSLERRIDEALKLDPALTYDQIHERFLSEHEGRVMMNQISSRIFEAIALGSALVLFEGDYSGVIREQEHFIPLKKDFSNVDEVLTKLNDTEALEQMTRRAYADVIESGKYSYEKFVSRFDLFLRDRVSPHADNDEMFWLSAGGLRLSIKEQRMTHGERQLWITSDPFSSSENCREFFSSHGARLSDQQIAEIEGKLSNEQAHVLRLLNKAEELRSARNRSMQRAESSATCSAILSALLASRWVALLRALGLCGQPPKLKPSRPEENIKALVDYVKTNGWLRLIVSRDLRLRRAMGLPNDSSGEKTGPSIQDVGGTDT